MIKKIVLSIGFFICFSAFAMERGLLHKSKQGGYAPSKLDICNLTWSPIKIKKALNGERVEFKRRVLRTAVEWCCSPATIRWLVYKCGAPVNIVSNGKSPLNYFISAKILYLDVHKETIQALFEVGCPLDKKHAQMLYSNSCNAELKEVGSRVLKKAKK